jgi:hypothetical protein
MIFCKEKDDWDMTHVLSGAWGFTTGWQKHFYTQSFTKQKHFTTA